MTTDDDEDKKDPDISIGYILSRDGRVHRFLSGLQQPLAPARPPAHKSLALHPASYFLFANTEKSIEIYCGFINRQQPPNHKSLVLDPASYFLFAKVRPTY